MRDVFNDTYTIFFLFFFIKAYVVGTHLNCLDTCFYKEVDKNSAEGVIAHAGAKVTGATIRMWLLNKFISILAVLSWKTGLKKM